MAETTPTMTTRAQEVLAEQNSPQPEQLQQDAVSADKKKSHKEFKTRIDVCKTNRKKLIANWKINIDYRRAKPFASQSDEDRINVPLDWSLTKAKQASLYSQTPQVRVSHFPDSAAQGSWLGAYERKLNDSLVSGGVEAAMDEALPDCINASGLGVVLVAHDAITEMVEVPVSDPALLPPGAEVKKESVPRIVDHRYTVQRISPADLLWPTDFTGSDFDNAPWLGRSGRVTWAEAVRLFGLNKEDKERILGEDKSLQDKLTHDTDQDHTPVDDMVGFDEIWYKDYQYNPDAKSYVSLHRLVFVQGKDEPIVDEPWEGQRWVEDKDQTQKVIGALKFPVRVLTLSYITDEAVPPSDSAMGRPQVNEINKGRTQMINQRERSIPIRWADINRMDPVILQHMMRGTWQSIIPVQGEGSRIIGEVARANHPQEDFEFDRIAKSDLTEVWSLGPNQAGTGRGVETAAEANNIQDSFQTRVGRERAKVAKFFVGMAEVLGGLLCIFEEPTAFGEGFDPSFSRSLAFSVLADSTVLVDSNQRLKKFQDLLNFTAKSGWLNMEPVMREIATLSGADPSVVIKAPEPPPPEQPSISVRLSGAEDMLNPLTLAFLMKSGQAPPPELVEQAKQLIMASMLPPQPPPMPEGIVPPPGSGPVGPAGDILPPPPGVGEAHPKLEAMPRINKRADGEAGG